MLCVLGKTLFLLVYLQQQIVGSLWCEFELRDFSTLCGFENLDLNLMKKTILSFSLVCIDPKIYFNSEIF